MVNVIFLIAGVIVFFLVCYIGYKMQGKSLIGHSYFITHTFYKNDKIYVYLPSTLQGGYIKYRVQVVNNAVILPGMSVRVIDARDGCLIVEKI